MFNKYDILNICYGLKVGQAVQFDSRDINHCFEYGWPSIYNTPRESLLSKLPGSGYGCYTVDIDPIKHRYIIMRHNGSERRVYVDPDREHLYELVDGQYLPVAMQKEM